MIVQKGLMFSCSYFFSTRELRGLSAVRHEILPHGRERVEFYNVGPKIWGLPLPKKLGGGQNMLHLAPFCTTSGFECEYLQNR